MSKTRSCLKCSFKEKLAEGFYYCPRLRAEFYSELLSQKLCEE